MNSKLPEETTDAMKNKISEDRLETMKSKTAVIGDRADTIGFKALGLATFSPEDIEPAASDKQFARNLPELISRLASLGYEIIFITEDLLVVQSDIMKSISDDALPAIIPIPGRAGSLGIGISAIRENIIRAAGADIIT